MRWKAWIRGLASVLALVGGCKQRVFMSECDYGHYGDIMPAHLDADPNATAGPIIDQVGTPPDIYNPDREIRHISLAECISIALEQGDVGNQNVAFASASPLFISSDQPVSFNGGRANSPTDSIRVLALDPAIQGANVENALSKFDAVLSSSVSWQNTDRPVGTPLDAFQTGSTGANSIEQQDANVSAAILKPLASGGVAGITFKTDYQITTLPARVNPSYRPTLQFQFEQPLLQGFGVEINQLRGAHPGSILNPGVLNTQPTNEGILITRLRFDQQRGEFERLVQNMVVNVELAYWNLYNAYWTLYAREAAMRQAFEAWKISTAKYQAGRVSIADLAQTRGQYELFRGQRIQALNDLLDFERQLRGMLGMHIEDGHRLVPIDTPTLAPYRPDWSTSLQEALTLQPFIYEARIEVKAAQMAVILAKNQLLPDLRFTSSYDVNGIGGRLDGPDDGNALRSLSSDHFNNWSLGLRLNVPIGFRSAHANLRIARLNLARSYALLRDNELKTERFLAQQFRLLGTYYELIRSNRAQREAFAEQLRARFEEFRAGRGTLDLLLEAQRFWAQALSDEYTAIASYNKALAQFEFAKGTIMQHDNVVISEGALPGCAQVRAVEHQRERTKALVLCERSQPIEHAPFQCDGVPYMPKLPNDKAVSVPALLEKAPPLPTSPDKFPIERAPAPAPAEGNLESSSLPQVGPASKLPVETPPIQAPVIQAPAAKPARHKPDPRKPSNFGALRPASESSIETMPIQPPLISVPPAEKARLEEPGPIMVTPPKQSSSIPAPASIDLPYLPGSVLPPISSK